MKVYVCLKKPQSEVGLQELLNVYMWRKWQAESWPGGVFVKLLSDIAVEYRF